MIAIISVLGSVLLLGGGYAIWDGWPYLVLERGFTQVILGAIAAAVGLFLLALVPVLGELRRLRSTVAGLAVVSAQASLLPEIDSPVPVAPARPEPSVGAPIALGAAAAVAATAAATAGAKADTAAEPSPEPTTASDPDVEEVAALPELPADDEAGERADVPAAPQEDVDIAEVDPVEPEFAGLVNLAEEGEPADIPVPDETGPTHEDAHIPWPTLDDRPGDAGDIPWPTRDSALGSSTADDDLGLLREQLTRGPRAPDWRAADEEIAASGAWMNTPAADDADDAAGSDVSLQREEHVLSQDEPDADSDPWTWPDTLTPPSAEGSASETTDPVESDLVGAETVTDESVTEPVSEPFLAEADDEPEQPAASDEGVIGAYQVGDTHFTMFADGSIRARTREGEYTFASMDELKAYLASEKSRLDA